MSMGEAIGYIIGALLGLIICLISEIILEKKKNRKLQDKVEMLDFFYEGNGFKRRGLNNSIQIAEYIKKLEAQIEKMKNQWNCKNNNGYCVSSICPCKDKWELKEK